MQKIKTVNRPRRNGSLAKCFPVESVCVVRLSSTSEAVFQGFLVKDTLNNELRRFAAHPCDSDVRREG